MESDAILIFFAIAKGNPQIKSAPEILGKLKKQTATNAGQKVRVID